MDVYLSGDADDAARTHSSDPREPLLPRHLIHGRRSSGMATGELGRRRVTLRLVVPSRRIGERWLYPVGTPALPDTTYHHAPFWSGLRRRRVHWPCDKFGPMSDRDLLDDLIFKLDEMQEQLSMARLEAAEQSLLAARIRHLSILAVFVRSRLEQMKEESGPPVRVGAETRPKESVS